MDWTKGYYSTNTTLQNLEKIADNMNEQSLMQKPVKVQGGVSTPLADTKPATFQTTKSLVASLWSKITNLFK